LGLPAAGKKERLARWIHSTGAASLLRRFPQRNALLVINYHRVGDSGATPYDPAVFSADAADFRAQMEFLARHLVPVTLAEALSFLDHPAVPHPTGRCRALLTFDDGYRDNFEIAFPILRELGMQATFFLPTSFVGTAGIPWWDQIAYIVKGARRRAFTLSYPRAAAFDLDAAGLRNVLRQVLNLYKTPEMLDSDRFLAELETACAGKRPDGGERCFMTWDQAAQMARGGMAIGAHTHTHRLLGRLSEAEQVEELEVPRRILREKAFVEADTIAYPVGARTSFTEETKTLTRQAGYRAGFSFYGGINEAGRVIDRYDVRRVGVDAQSLERFRVQTAAAATVGRWWP
jgi:peptidoglycan/xylan/chitin deacetylase (PgdA/CDA1 family)